MKRLISISVLFAVALFLGCFLTARAQGTGTLTQLDQWKATTTPYSAIAPNVAGKNIYAPFSSATTSSLYASKYCINLLSPTCITSWPTGGTGSVGTSTTDVPGYVPFFTSSAATPALIGGDPAFFWDNTNKRHGIGTTTPAFPLTVINPTNNAIAVGDGTAGDSLWTLGSINSNFYIASTAPATWATSTVPFLSVATATGATLNSNLVLNGALTYGGVKLSQAVTGTASMVLSTSPILTTPVMASMRGGSAVSSSGIIQGTSAATYISGGGATIFQPFNALEVARFVGASSSPSANTPGGLLFGTTTPFVELVVASSTASGGTWRGQFALTDNSAGVNLKHWLFNSQGGDLTIGTTTDLFATSTIPTAYFTRNGFLGLASSSPGTLFSVGNAFSVPSTGTSTHYAPLQATQFANTGLNSGKLIGTGAGGYQQDITVGSGLSLSGGTLTASGGASFPFTPSVGYNSTTTVIGFNGLFSTASSTFGSSLYLPSLSQGVLYNGSLGITQTVATGTVSAGSSAITVTAGRSAIGGALAIDCATASGSQNGCLSSTDWTTFFNKMSSYDPFTHLAGAATTSAFGTGTTTPSSQLSVSTSTQSTALTSLFAVASTTNATLFNVLGGGNVGVGTTTPGTLFSINGSANFTTGTSTILGNGLLAPQFSATASSTFNGLTLLTGGETITTLPSCNTGSALTTDTSGHIVCGAITASATASGGTGAVQVANGTAISSDPTTFFWDLTNHRLGIGTTTPAFALTAVDPAKPQIAIGDGVAGNSLFFFRAIGNNFEFGTTSTASWATTTPDILSISGSLGTTLNSNLTLNGSTTLTRALTYGGVTLSNAVTGTGSMVLSASPTLTGTETVPAIRGGTGATNNLTLSATNNTTVTTGGDVIVQAYNTQEIGRFTGVGAKGTNTPGGLGLGTTSPFVLLSISTSTAAGGTFKGQLSLDDFSAAAGLKHWLFTSQGGDLTIGTTSDVYATSTIPALYMTRNGWLGIGTSSPGTALSVGTSFNVPFTGTSSATGLNLLSGGLTLTTLQSCNTLKTDSGGNVLCNASAGVTGSGAAGQATFWTGASAVSGDNAFWWDNTNKRLGLGTTTPAFTVTSVNASAPQMSYGDGTAGDSLWFERSISNSFFLGTTSPSSWATSTVAAITISPNGYLGLGTTTPGSLLSLVGTANFGTATSTIFSNTNISGVLNVSNAATSTFASGIHLSAGCVSMPDGGCLSGTTLIASGSLPAAATQDITNIPATFSYLILVIADASCDTTSRQLEVRASTDNGSTFDANVTDYNGSRFNANAGSSIAAFSVASIIDDGVVQTQTDNASTTAYIYGYGGNSRMRVSSFSTRQVNTSRNVMDGYYAPAGSATPAVNALRIMWNSGGNFDNGTYALYGVR